MDSDRPEGNELEFFITTVKTLFPNMLTDLNVEQKFNPVTMFNIRGSAVAEMAGPTNTTINLRFSGPFEEMLRVREFMKNFAYNTAIQEQVDSSGIVRTTCEFIVAGAALKSNRKLYDAQFEMLLEDELSKKQEK